MVHARKKQGEEPAGGAYGRPAFCLLHILKLQMSLRVRGRRQQQTLQPAAVDVVSLFPNGRGSTVPNASGTAPYAGTISRIIGPAGPVRRTFTCSIMNALSAALSSGCGAHAIVFRYTEMTAPDWFAGPSGEFFDEMDGRDRTQSGRRERAYPA